MNSQELIDRFRLDASDNAAPYLWSDDELVSYIDGAQRQLVRSIGGLLDSSSVRTTVVVPAGASSVPKPKGLLHTESARWVNARKPLRVVSRNDVDLSDLVEGEVTALVTDADDANFLFDRINQVEDTLKLTILRLPLKRVSDVDAQLEVDDEYFDCLLAGLKSAAYSKQDADTFDQRAAEKYQAEFSYYLDQAAKATSRRREPVRTVAYGGI